MTTKDSSTGEEKKEVVKIPVTKNKVFSKNGAATPASAEAEVVDAKKEVNET